jgi:hypothetical protein
MTVCLLADKKGTASGSGAEWFAIEHDWRQLI